MRKIYLVSTFCLMLAITGIFTVNISYSGESSVTISQPQLDTSAFAKKAHAANENNAATAQGAVESSVQMKASSSGTFKNRPSSANEQSVEHYSFRDGEGVPK